jgi:hypothetical protein
MLLMLLMVITEWRFLAGKVMKLAINNINNH